MLNVLKYNKRKQYAALHMAASGGQCHRKTQHLKNLK